ncbi:hypothetical protein A0J61_10953 [Choanephora cucurbitarum]|uniref:Secreted protein n=1 Tax=Choanephora cucurbitarum TaxID=101091 RepID=A0A1C7MW58_9FUNG|nr:hypothetical protein A0J61_10953 [Choanephora cucurbitarum]
MRPFPVILLTLIVSCHGLVIYKRENNKVVEAIGIMKFGVQSTKTVLGHTAQSEMNLLKPPPEDETTEPTDQSKTTATSDRLFS